MQATHEQHELDVFARKAAIDKYCRNDDGTIEDFDVKASERIISFSGGFTLDDGETRVTVWELDETVLVVYSEAVGEGDPAHSVLEINL